MRCSHCGLEEPTTIVEYLSFIAYTVLVIGSTGIVLLTFGLRVSYEIYENGGYSWGFGYAYVLPVILQVLVVFGFVFLVICALIYHIEDSERQKKEAA